MSLIRVGGSPAGCVFRYVHLADYNTIDARPVFFTDRMTDSKFRRKNEKDWTSEEDAWPFSMR